MRYVSSYIAHDRKALFAILNIFKSSRLFGRIFYSEICTNEKAMELTKEIFKDISESHLTAMGTHYKVRDGGIYHSHTVTSPTNINDGSMLYGDYKTNYALTQRVADVTGQPTKLVIYKENGEEKECPMIFVPREIEE